ncbi:MAG TPA: hypothetical protein VHB74_00580 [Devosia sp.]|nr:hypothetical protein [Devosia sp.]
MHCILAQISILPAIRDGRRLDPFMEAALAQRVQGYADTVQDIEWLVSPNPHPARHP